MNIQTPLLILAIALGSASCRTDVEPGTNSLLKEELESVPFTLSSQIRKPVPFLEYASYLAMNLNYKPIDRLKLAVASRTRSKLKNRGEAHITVLSPQEFSALSKQLDKKDINALATAENIQATEFSTVCVGSGSLTKSGKTESTYYVVVKADGLVALRQKLLDAYSKAGGSGTPYEADHYYPHITIGFTKTDLHEEQGVIKNEKSCIAALEELN